jgi:hypothetical protein
MCRWSWGVWLRLTRAYRFGCVRSGSSKSDRALESIFESFKSRALVWNRRVVSCVPVRGDGI